MEKRRDESQKIQKKSEKIRNCKKNWKWNRKLASSCSPWHLVYGFDFGKHQRYRKVSFSNTNLHWQDLTLPCGLYWYFHQSRRPTPHVFVKSLWLRNTASSAAFHAASKPSKKHFCQWIDIFTSVKQSPLLSHSHPAGTTRDRTQTGLEPKNADYRK